MVPNSSCDDGLSRLSSRDVFLRTSGDVLEIADLLELSWVSASSDRIWYSGIVESISFTLFTCSFVLQRMAHCDAAFRRACMSVPATFSILSASRLRFMRISVSHFVSS